MLKQVVHIVTAIYPLCLFVVTTEFNEEPGPFGLLCGTVVSIVPFSIPYSGVCLRCVRLVCWNPPFKMIPCVSECFNIQIFALCPQSVCVSVFLMISTINSFFPETVCFPVGRRETCG
jgi:hypothetical protein